MKQIEIVQKYPLLGSSADPTKVGATVKGILLAIIPTIILLTGAFGIGLDVSELDNLAELIGSAVTAVWFAGSAILAVYGAGRKIYIKYFK